MQNQVCPACGPCAFIQPAPAVPLASCPSFLPGHAAAKGAAEAQHWGLEPHSHFIPPPPLQNCSSPQLLVISCLRTHCIHMYFATLQSALGIT